MNTIRRQYSLPNCTLVIEGLSDPAGQGAMDYGRPVLSTAFNVECAFAGIEPRLSGGREFLDSLAKAASAYAQEFLSGIRHPPAHQTEAAIISFAKTDNSHLHRLIWHPTAEKNGVQVSAEPVEIDLTTVQLFDLVEAIDQLLADSQTLPDLRLTIAPVSRRYRQADVPIARRAAPAILGITSLAAAGVLFFLLPVPKRIEEPRPVQKEQVEGQASPTPTPGASPTPSETPSTASSPLTPEQLEALQASQITDPTTVEYIERNLRRKLDETWQERDRVQNRLQYRVAVTKGGSIIDFKPVEGTSEESAELTPLPQLRYTPTDLGQQESIAEYRVVFTRNSVLQVSPWLGNQGKASYGPQIEDSSTLERLQKDTYEKIRKAWSGVPSYSRPLEFRVGVTEDGAIADYEPQNQSAYDYVKETPLPSLIEPAAAGIEEGKNLVPDKPLGQFKVVFKPSGVLEVSTL